MRVFDSREGQSLTVRIPQSSGAQDLRYRVQGEDGQTALHLSAAKGAVDSCTVLARAVGAERIDTMTKAGLTPLHKVHAVCADLHP